MKYDYKAARWSFDIKSFDRWKITLERILHKEGDFYDEHRERIRGYMRDIQARWPQFIKLDEIP